MKKVTKKKAAPKIDLDCLNFCAVATVILIFAFGISALVMISRIETYVGAIHRNVDDIEFSAVRSNLKLSHIDDSLNEIEWDIRKMKAEKAKKACK